MINITHLFTIHLHDSNAGLWYYIDLEVIDINILTIATCYKLLLHCPVSKTSTSLINSHIQSDYFTHESHNYS